MGSNYALQFASPRVASFIAGLFMEVAEAAALELCGWVPSFPEFACFTDMFASPEFALHHPCTGHLWVVLFLP